MANIETKTSSPHWRLRAEVLVWRYGWSWFVAVMLMVCLAAVHVALVIPASQERDRQQQVWAELANPLSRTVEKVDPAELAKREATELKASLLQPAQVNPTLRRIHALALQQGLLIEQTEFSQSMQSQDGVQRLQLVMPVRGGYLALQPYVFKLLREFPALSVDQISLKRDRVEQAQAEARLRVSLWIQQDAVNSKGRP